MLHVDTAMITCYVRLLCDTPIVRLSHLPQKMYREQMVHMHVRSHVYQLLVTFWQGCDLVPPDIGADDQANAMHPDRVHILVARAAPISGLVDKRASCSE